MKNLIKRISSVVVAGALVLGSVAILPGTKKKVVYAAEPKYDSANLVNYATIMGRAVDYGIVSQSITQSMHMETTFATYSYSRTVDTTTDVDLTNAKTAQFIIGEVTSRGDLGTLKFGKVRTSTGDVFVENMSITLSEGMDPNRYIRYQDDVAKTTKFNYSYRTKKEIQESIDTVIDHARDESEEMVTRTGDADYVLDSKNNSLVSVNGSITTININDPKYDNKVVYVNLDDAKFKNLLSAWATEPNGHHLDINKRSSTVVVFTSAKKEAITLGKVSVYAKDSPLYASAASTGVHDYDSYASVTTYSGNQSTHNAYVDKEIAQKLIWNITGSNDITISSNAGTFLCLAGDKTNRNVKVKLKGNPCAGWLVVNGNVKNECEYHYIYGGHSQSQGTEGEGQMHFVARKGFTTKYADKDHITPYVDNSVAFKEGDYQFFWQEYTDDTFRTPVGQKSTVKVKDTSYMEFPTVTFVKNTPSDPHNVTAAGKNFYFRITEDPSKSLSGIKNSAGHIDVCLNAYVSNTGVIKFKMQSVTMIGADDTHLIQYDKNGTWGSSTDWVDVVNTRFDLGAFFNKIQVPGYMTITKTIEGDVTEEDLNGLTFTVTDGGAFTKVYKLGKDFTKNPTTGIYELTTPITVPDAETQYTVTETLYSLDGYKLEEVSYKVDGGATQHNNDTASLDSVSTDSNAPTTVAYTDSYTPLGTLTVKKTAKADNNKNINYYYKFSVKNSAGQYLQADKKTFGAKEVFFTIGTDETVEFKDIPVDEYTITEKTNDLFVYGYTFEAASSITNGKADVTKKANTDFTLDNRFTMDRGSLTVKKTATDNNGNSVEGTFKFTISTPMRGYLQADGSFGNTIHYFTISDGESMTFDNLPVDNYNVTEDLNSVSVTGYTFNSTDSKYSVLGRVTKNGNTNAELVNKYTQDVGELRVTKTAQDNHNTNVSGSFEFSVKNSKGQYLQADKKTFDTTEVFFTVEAGSYTSFENLPVGKYTVTEKTDSISVNGYTFTSTGSTTSDSATVAKDTTVEVKLINNFIQDLGSLTVAKIAKDNNFADVAGVFEFSVKNSKNQYLQSDEKTFGGTEVFFSVDAGSSKTFTDLPVGEYTITEKTDSINVPGYTYNALTSVTSVAGKVSKTTTANSTVTLTNIFTKDVGRLTVSKTAKDNNGNDLNRTFSFSVKNDAGLYLQSDGKTFGTDEYFFSVASGSSVVFEKLPVGEYTIQEDLSSVDIADYTFRMDTSIYHIEKTVSKDSDVKAELINYYKQDVGTLKVKKTAIDDKNRDVISTFLFSVKNSAGLYLQADEKTFAATEVFFSIDTSETKEFSNLPVGEYTIAENTDKVNIDGYTFLIDDSDITVSATIAKDGTANAALNNKFTFDVGQLTVIKEAIDNYNNTVDGTFKFSVMNSKGKYLQSDKETFGDSEYFFTVTTGTPTVFPELPIGKYTITEDTSSADVSGYTFLQSISTTTVETNVVNLINVNATLTNKYEMQLGSLKITKALGSNAPRAAASKTYTFTVTGPNGYSATVQINGARSETLTDLIPGTYTVTEDENGAAISGYDLYVTGGGSVKVLPNDVATTTVTNDYTEILGSLTVKKEVNGAPASEADKRFEFAVMGPNRYITFFNLKAGEQQILPGLPLGKYTVTELGTDARGRAQIKGYTLAVSGEGSVELTTADLDAEVTITNNYTEILGSLTVKKEVNGAPASAADKEFEFTVTGPNGYSETFTLKNGETKTLTDLHLGTYNVTETGTAANGAAQIEGYTLAVSGEGDVELTTSSVDGTATITNAYTEILGSLTVKKEVTDAPASEANKVFEFTVTGPNSYSETFTLKAGETKTLTDLKLGTYTVTENDTAAQISGYDLVVSGEGDVELTVSAKDGSATVSNAYTQQKGVLIVAKTAKDDSNKDVNGTFYFSVKNSNGQYLQTDEKTFNTAEVFFEVMAGDFTEFTDIPVDTYTITEDTTRVNVTGFDFLTTGSATEANVSVAKNTAAQANLVNNYQKHLGTLTVSKTAKDDKNADLTGTFQFSVKNSEGKFLQADEKTFDTAEVFFTVDAGSSKVFDNLPVGEYVVTEKTTNISISGYTFDSVNSRTNGRATVTLNGTAEVELINKFTLDLGSLTITKALGANAPASASSKEYTFTVTGPNKFSQTVKIKGAASETLTGLVPGTYHVSEDPLSAIIRGYDVVIRGGGDVDVAANATAEKTITNTYIQQKGDLKITKVLGANAPAYASSKKYSFTVTGPDNFNKTVTIEGAGSETLTGLVPGTYTVTEDEKGAAIDGYDLVVTGGGDVSVQGNATAKTTVTNTYTEILGSLTVKKEVTGAPASEANKVFEFTVTGPNSYSETFTLKSGETKTLTDLKLGTYTVTENDTAAQISGYDLVVTGEGDVTLTAADKDKTATVTNAYSDVKGSLTVKKTVTGAPASEANKTFEFTVTGPNNYSETFTLKNGESKTLSDLALGTYTVTENGTAANGTAQITGYDLVVTGEGDVTLTASDKDKTETVTNAYTEILGSLTVTKKVTGAPASEANKTFEFTVTGPNNYSETFTLKNGESKTLSDLALGTYTVTENGTAANGTAQISGYDLVVSGEGDVTLTASDKDKTETVTNAYTEILGSLTVTKTVTGAPASEANKTFEFTVTGPNNYSETFTLKAGESKTLTDLKLGTYTVAETGTAANGAAQITGYDLVVSGEGDVTLTASAKDGSASVTNTYTQKKGSLIVSKTAKDDSNKDVTGTFEFSVKNSEGKFLQADEKTFDTAEVFFTVAAGSSKAFADLPVGGYVVTEKTTNIAISGYTFDQVNSTTSDTATITNNGTAEVELINKYILDLGSLTITKALGTNAPSAAALKTYTFTVSGPNGYSAIVQIDGAGSETLTDLVPGRYTVTENETDAAISGYDLVVSGGGAVEVVAKTVATTTITNTYTEVKGSLTVTKTVTGAPASEANKTFEFTVTGPNNYSTTVTLKDGESQTLTDLALGTYTITENGTAAGGAAQISGYTLAVSGEGNVELTATDKAKTATVTNAYTEEVKGSLTVTKTVTGAPASEANKTFEFTVTGPNNYSTTVKLKAGESQTLTDLALGKYTVTENGTAAGGAAQISGYKLAVSGEGDVELTATDKAKTATVTNAYTEEVKGSLTVTKTVTGAPASAFDKEFEFTVTGPNNYSETFKLKNGERKVLSDLALGTYTVAENGTASDGAAQIKGYTLAVSGDGDVTLTASDKDKTSAVTNAYTETNEKTSVSIQKVWDDNNNQNGDRPASLTVTLSNGQSVVLDDSNAWSATVNDLPKYENGSEIVYSWSEEQVQGYRMSSSVKDQNDPSKTIITNTYDASSVQTSATVKKVWDDNNDAAGLRPSSLVVYLLQNGTQINTCTLNEQNGWTATVNNLAKYDASNVEYVYTWTEEQITVAGYALDGESVSGTTTTLTNKYTAPAPVLGSLKIKKALAAGAPTDASSMTYHFTVTGTKGYTTTVDIQGEGEFVLDNLELDTYTVTEDTAFAAISGYTLSVTNNGATVVINSANQEECVITNTYKKDVQTTPDPTGTNPTGTEPTGTEPTGTKPSGTKPSVESPYSEVQEPSETTPTPTTAPDKKIDSVSIDDKPVSPDDYTDKPDGTVEFSSNTIEGLTLGVHRALIKYNDGTTITIEFEVVSSAGRGRSIVKTGDMAKSNLVPAAAFLSIAVAAVAIVIFRRRRTERDAK